MRKKKIHFTSLFYIFQFIIKFLLQKKKNLNFPSLLSFRRSPKASASIQSHHNDVNSLFSFLLSFILPLLPLLFFFQARWLSVSLLHGPSPISPSAISSFSFPTLSFPIHPRHLLYLLFALAALY